MAATTNLTEEQQSSPADWRDFEHIGPGTLAGRFMRRFWHPVYLARDLVAGRAKPVKILGEDFTLYRGESGEVHAVAFRCAHRGTQLSTGWVEGDELRCFYHGWKYGPDGQCTEQPAEPEPFCNRIKIRSYPVQEYIGLIFAYLGEGEAPEFPRFPEFEGDGILENSSYVRMCNYFNQLESNMDEAHVAFVHRNSDFTTVGLNNDIPYITGEETDYGVVKYGHRKDQPVRVSHFFMPNALWIAGSGGAIGGTVSQNLAWRVPIDDFTHQSFNASYIPLTGEAADRYRQRQAERRTLLQGKPTSNEITAAILRGELHADDVADRPDVVNIQDNVAQGGQGIIADRIHEHLGATDVMIVTFRRIWEREMRALAEGRPLKEWKRTGELAATFGT
jgi:5,5'-dehydrodivanillate O-demethylase oxygenase subunit